MSVMMDASFVFDSIYVQFSLIKRSNWPDKRYRQSCDNDEQQFAAALISSKYVCLCVKFVCFEIIIDFCLVTLSKVREKRSSCK